MRDDGATRSEPRASPMWDSVRSARRSRSSAPQRRVRASVVASVESATGTPASIAHDTRASPRSARERRRARSERRAARGEGRACPAPPQWGKATFAYRYVGGGYGVGRSRWYDLARMSGDATRAPMLHGARVGACRERNNRSMHVLCIVCILPETLVLQSKRIPFLRQKPCRIAASDQQELLLLLAKLLGST